MQAVTYQRKFALDLQNQQTGTEERQVEPMFNIAPVVLILVVVCAAVHLVRTYLLNPQQDLAFLLHTAFIPARYSGAYDFDVFSVTSVITYSLVHGDWIHFAINMVWLAAFGSPLANRIGARRFIAFWCFTSIAAVTLHGALHHGDPVMVIGASGAVSGMMAAAARFGFRVHRSGRQPAFSGPRLPIPAVLQNRTAVVFLAVWFVVNLIAGLGYLMPGETSPIAWEAHIGGFAAGFFCLGLFDRQSFRN